MKDKNDNTEKVWKDRGFGNLDPQELSKQPKSPVEPDDDVLDDDELEEIAGGGISGDLGCGN